MVTMLRKLEGEIWALAAEVLTPTQRQELRDLLRAWRDKYPDKIGVSFIRFSDFGELGRKPSLEQARKAGGLLAPIKHATQAAEEIRLLGDRALYLLSRMVELVNSRANLTVQELLITPDIALPMSPGVSERYAEFFEALPPNSLSKRVLMTPIAQLLADVTRLRKVSERYAELFEALPAQLTEQMRATINQTMAQGMRQTASIIENTIQQVSAERHAAIEQAMGGIAQERQGALEQLLEGVSEERRALLVGIEQVLDRGGVECGAMDDPGVCAACGPYPGLFRGETGLPLCRRSSGWYTVQALDRVCWAGGDSRADRGRSAGVRPAQFAPQVCCVGCRACGPCPSRHVHGARRTRVSRTHGGASGCGCQGGGGGHRA